MLLDDVMSELDGERRELLAARLTASGQALLTATGVDHVPIADSDEVMLVEVGEGAVRARPENASS
jgi:recombinational DNA repair ATPase RecF